MALIKDLIQSKTIAMEDPFEPLPKSPLLVNVKKILPPYLGEMGLEVRGFLGIVEPWLNSGWIIPAKRPGLYPHNRAFFDQIFFDRINEIKNYYHITEMVGTLFSSKPVIASELRYELLGDEIAFSAKIDDIESVRKIVAAEKSIRLAILQRYKVSDSVPSQFHEPFTTVTFPGFSSLLDLNWAALSAIVPTYKPLQFINPSFSTQPHIGIQFRNLPKNPSRNSNVEKMLAVCNLAARLLGLPVLVYGANEDLFPKGYQVASDLVPKSMLQLDGELALLHSCKLMVAPDSGWADLMGWLGVPTLLEQQYYAWGFEGLRQFNPKILVMKDGEDNVELILQLINSPSRAVLLPEASDAVNAISHLAPGSQLLRSFWNDYGQ